MYDVERYLNQLRSMVELRAMWDLYMEDLQIRQQNGHHIPPETWADARSKYNNANQNVDDARFALLNHIGGQGVFDVEDFINHIEQTAEIHHAILRLARNR